MSSTKYYCIKRIAVIGNHGVGKTSLIHALTDHEFLEDCESTIGAGFTQLAVTKRDLVMMNRLNYESAAEMLAEFENQGGLLRQIQIWDTAGDEKYRSLIPIYLRNASLVLICYEASEENSANQVLTWRQICREEGIHDDNMILVATKEDLVDRRTGGVYLMPDVMTSSKTGSGIEMLKTLLIYRSLRDADIGNNFEQKSLLGASFLEEKDNKRKCC